MIETTLSRGLRAGLRASLAPLLTDVPLVLAAVWFLQRLPEGLLAWITLGGGLLVVAMGLSSMRAALTATLEAALQEGGHDLLRAAMVNLLNPNPWIFWVGVGGPIVVSAWQSRPVDAIGFLVTFIGCLVGLKMLLAVALSNWRDRLSLGTYRRLLIGAALLLMLVGAVLVVNGLRAVLS